MYTLCVGLLLSACFCYDSGDVIWNAYDAGDVMWNALDSGNVMWIRVM